MMMTVVFTVGCGLLAAWLGHPVGIAPVVAGVVCAACFLRRRDVFVVALGAMLLHDALVGVSAFTFVRMAAIVSVAGVVCAWRAKPRLISALGGILLAAPIYHLILIVGDWATQTCAPYARTFAGLASAMSSSWPYVQRVMLSDVLFTSLFVGCYTLAGAAMALRWPTLLPQSSRG